jgi:hypothetical protein
VPELGIGRNLPKHFQGARRQISVQKDIHAVKRQVRDRAVCR